MSAAAAASSTTTSQSAKHEKRAICVVEGKRDYKDGETVGNDKRLRGQPAADFSLNARKYAMF